MHACKYRPGRKTEAPLWIRGLVLRPAKPHAFFVFYVHYGGKYLVFVSSRSVKMRGFSFLSLYKSLFIFQFLNVKMYIMANET